MLSCMGVLLTQQDGALVRHVILHRRPFFSVVEIVSLLQVLIFLESYEHKGMSRIFAQQHRITAAQWL